MNSLPISRYLDTRLRISRSLPKHSKNFFSIFYKEHQKFLDILISFELSHDYQISFTPTNNRNTEPIELFDAFAKVCYWLNEDNKKEAKAVFRTFPYDIQQVISSTFSRSLTNYLGKDFILDTIQNFFSVSELFVSEIKLPLRLSSGYEEYLEGLSRDSSIENYKLPAILLEIPKNLRKSSKMYYFVKDGNKVHSNINSNLVREVLKKNFLYASFGLIFLFSKRENKRYGKVLLPICYSNTPRKIIKLYRGGTEVSLSNYEFDLRDKFKDINEKYLTIKYPRVSTLENSIDLKSSLATSSQHNYIVFDTGIHKLKFKRVERYEKVSDFILDEEYIPIGVKLASGEEFMVNISQAFLDGGIENRYVRLFDIKFAGETLKSELYDILGAGLFECKYCGKVTKANFKGFCHACYRNLKYLSDFSIVERKVYDVITTHMFSTEIGKYRISSDKEKVTFDRDLSLVKGQQLLLPFND